MTPEQLLRDALASASPDEAGIETLCARIADGEKALAAARAELAQRGAEESALVARQGALNERLAALGRDLLENKRAAGRTILGAIDDRKKFAAVAAETAAKHKSLADQVDLLRDALQFVVLELIPAAQVTKTVAEIAIGRASLSWVTASAHFDLLKLEIELAPALHHDSSLTVGVGPGSHAHVFSAKINELELRLNELGDRLQRERAIAEQKAFREAA